VLNGGPDRRRSCPPPRTQITETTQHLEHFMDGVPLRRRSTVGVETADLLVHEVLSRPMRDRRAVARYAGLTGSPDAMGAWCFTAQQRRPMDRLLI
jgi:hypothetical protein